MITIRPEEANDHDAVRPHKLTAFEGRPEAELVDVVVYDSGALPDGGGVAKHRDEFDAAM